jgi:hypothetical protein
MMCLMAMASEAQVITSATVNKVYEEVSADASNGFVYNAEYDDNGCIIAQDVYRNVPCGKSDLNLIPTLRYHYAYHADGTLASRTKYEWRGGKWQCYGKLDYTLSDGRYTVEYSRWNRKKSDFDLPCGQMTYTLLANDEVTSVACYYRHHKNSPLELAWTTTVEHQPVDIDYYLSHLLR